MEVKTLTPRQAFEIMGAEPDGETEITEITSEDAERVAE